MHRKAIFDLVRRLLGRGFHRAEIVALDAAIDAAQHEETGEQGFAEHSACPDRVGPDGVALIKRFEGLARQRSDGLIEAYPDPGTGSAPWTIGWGATGPDIARGTVWTREECDARLDRDLRRFARDVARTLGGAATSQAEFDALVSFHYNPGAIGRATLTRLHREGRHGEAAREFHRWIHAGGRPLEGLRRRRAAEAALYAGR